MWARCLLPAPADYVVASVIAIVKAVTFCMCLIFQSRQHFSAQQKKNVLQVQRSRNYDKSIAGINFALVWEPVQQAVPES